MEFGIEECVMLVEKYGRNKITQLGKNQNTRRKRKLPIPK